MTDEQITDWLIAVAFVGGIIIGCWFGHSWGEINGHDQACASIQTEWRDAKCVRVVVEDVK
jgi:hypothetical protein